MADYMYPPRAHAGRYDDYYGYPDRRRPRFDIPPEPRHPRSRSMDYDYRRRPAHRELQPRYRSPPPPHGRPVPKPRHHPEVFDGRARPRREEFPRERHHRPSPPTSRRRSPSPRRGRRSPQQKSSPPRRRAVSDTRPDNKMQQAATAAFNAAALEAMRVRKQPGQWNGQKGARVATAALGAAVTDKAAGHLRDDDDEDNSKRNMIESTVGGLLAGRLVHGSKNNLKSRDRGKTRHHR